MGARHVFLLAAFAGEFFNMIGALAQADKAMAAAIIEKFFMGALEGFGCWLLQASQSFALSHFAPAQTCVDQMQRPLAGWRRKKAGSQAGSFVGAAPYLTALTM